MLFPLIYIGQNRFTKFQGLQSPLNLSLLFIWSGPVADNYLAITLSVATKKRRQVDGVSDLSMSDSVPDGRVYTHQSTLEEFTEEDSAKPGRKKTGC